MSMEYGMNNTDKGVLKYWKKSFPKCHFIYYKSHFDCHGIQNGLPKWQASHSAWAMAWPGGQFQMVLMQYSVHCLLFRN